MSRCTTPVELYGEHAGIYHFGEVYPDPALAKEYPCFFEAADEVNHGG